ncbi:MAG TPA: SDR family NAD(P)-dependent oxidoreductase [Stellaceae bacterium]|nr:SDR family NAD(P)-dependent oxidoreductase [Stellaceae bacterium]
MTEGRKSGVALLVGAGDAIGAAVARRFAAGGYSVCVARRSAEKSQSLVQEIVSSGGVAHAVSTDVRNEEAVQALFAHVEAELGSVEVCLFNAGANVKSPLIDTSARLFFKAWELACYAGFLTGREAARYMVPRGRGTILFTGATASVRGGSGFAAFAAAKFGLRAVAQAMARELAPKNIHVAHLVIDGAIDSEAIHTRLSAPTGVMPDLAPDSLIQTRSVAEAYWALHNQSRDGWTHELDLRPYSERW